jgi:putative transposase
VQEALQAALSASARINLLEGTIACAVRDARELMEQEVAMRAGERYERSPAREGQRNGTAPGYVVVGGRKVKMRRPRLCTEEGRDIPLVSYGALQDPTILDQAALGKVIDGVAQRQAHASYARDQRLPADQPAYGDSKSSISRRWIEATGESLAERMNRRLDDRRYLAVLLDGKGFGEHLLVTALGIDEQGHKRVLGIRDGGSEDQAVCAVLLQDLMDRGLDVSAGVLVIIDGGKGLAAAVRALWGDVAVLGRCTEHYADIGIMNTRPAT